MPHKILVIGGSNIETCARTEHTFIPNDTNDGSFTFRIGGVGRNVAANFKNLGFNVSLLTALGDDNFGNIIASDCRRRKIDLLGSVFEKSTTGVYAYALNPDDSYAIGINDMNVMNCLSPSEIGKFEDEITSSPCIVIDANLSKIAIEKVCSYKTKIFADCVSNAKCLRFSDVIDKLYLLKCSQNELALLSGKKTLTDCIVSLTLKGLNRGLVSLGADGTMFFERKCDSVQTFLIPSIKGMASPCVSRYSEALLCGFITSLLSGKDYQSCLISSALATFDVNKMPSTEILLEKVNTYEKEITVKKDIIRLNPSLM